MGHVTADAYRAEQLAPIVAQCRQREFDVNQAVILAPQLDLCTLHRLPGIGPGVETVALADITIDLVGLSPHHLGALVAEDTLGCVVELYDRAVHGSRGDHIRGMIQDAGQIVARLLHRQRVLLGFGELRLQVVGHAVEALRQKADLVLAQHLGTGSQVARLQARHGSR